MANAFKAQCRSLSYPSALSETQAADIHTNLCRELNSVADSIARIVPAAGQILKIDLAQFAEQKPGNLPEYLLKAAGLATSLASLSSPLLYGVRALLNISLASSSETSLAVFNPKAQSRHKLSSYDRVEDVSQRQSLRKHPEDPALGKAQRNLQEAYERSEEGYLKSYYERVERYCEALISGEIAAPSELRWDVVRFIARSPEHAAGYMDILCSDADLAGILEAEDLWTHVPDPKNIDPLKLLPTTTAMERSSHVTETTAQPQLKTDTDFMDFGETPEILQEIRTIYRNPDYVGALLHLSQTLPDTFGNQAIQDLLAAGSVAEAALKLPPKERLIYLASCQADGRIPKGYLNHKNEYRWDMELPETAITTDLSEVNPLSAYVTRGAFQDVLRAWKPVTESDVRREINIFLQAMGDRAGERLREKVQLVENYLPNAPQEAFVGLLRLRSHVLNEGIGKQKRLGLKRLSDFSDRFESYLREGKIGEAKALLEYASSWTERVESLLYRADSLREELTLHDATSALEAFDRNVRSLLSAGKVDLLRAFVDKVEDQIKRRPITAKDKLIQLSSRVRMTAMTVLELLRILLLASTDKIKALSDQIPGVAGLLEGGSVTVQNVRRIMKNNGLPMPGDGITPAIPSRRALGFLHDPRRLNAVNMPHHDEE